MTTPTALLILGIALSLMFTFVKTLEETASKQSDASV
jgi:hypothetical protein